MLKIKYLGKIQDNKDLVTKEYVDQGLSNKQDTLPAGENDRYLHTNATTGALEWSLVSGGGADVVVYSDTAPSTNSLWWDISTGRLLPEGYVQLSYIESHGTEYIDTALSMASGFRVKGKICPTKSDYTNNDIIGAENSSSPWNLNLIRVYANTWKLCYGNHENDFGSVSTNTWYDIDFLVSPTVDATINNVHIGSATSTGTGTSGTLYIGAARHGSIIESYGKAKYGILEFLDTSGNQVAHFIPSIRLSDGEIGLYDLVSETFFTNQGTGTFGIGAVIDSAFNAGYQQVEYLGSTGTQYIDTGIEIDFQKDMKIKTELSLTQVSGEIRIAYCTNSSDNSHFGLNARSSTKYFGCAWGDYLRGGSQTFNWDIFYSLEFEGLKTSKNNRTLKVNGNDVSLTLDGVGYINHATRSLAVFGGHEANGSFNAGKMKMKYFMLSGDNASMLFLIPCYNKTTEVAGMYDLVSKTLFTNAGTGNFTLGSEVNP